MRFFSDVQIHSKWSRATSKNADIDHIALWARKKGITVVGTGDFTHPAWLSEIKEKLVNPPSRGCLNCAPIFKNGWMSTARRPAENAPVRFMLEVEISTIYKKWDKVRKVHHLIFVPDLEAADKLVARPVQNRQSQIRRAAYSGAGFARPAGNHAGERTRFLPDPGACVDAVVCRAGVQIRF